jgi:hypothetical protein
MNMRWAIINFRDCLTKYENKDRLNKIDSDGVGTLKFLNCCCTLYLLMVRQ